jgi:UDP-N-acetylglucosamine:LPS N-acetylglucosamine transferase
LQRAKLIVSRSGAGTIADVEYFEVPTIFIPYPHHADKQQYLNAKDLEESGACLVWEESSLNDFDQNRVTELRSFLKSDKLASMKSMFPQKDRERAVEIILKRVLKEKYISTR